MDSIPEKNQDHQDDISTQRRKSKVESSKTNDSGLELRQKFQNLIDNEIEIGEKLNLTQISDLLISTEKSV